MRLSPLGIVATVWPIVSAPDDDNCGPICGMRIGRGNRSTRRKPAPVSSCPPQILLVLTWPRTRAAAVGSRWQTAWSVARPGGVVTARILSRIQAVTEKENHLISLLITSHFHLECNLIWLTPFAVCASVQELTNWIHEAESVLVSQSPWTTEQFPNVLCNPMVYYCVHKNTSLVTIAKQTNPVHNTPSHFSKINFNIVRPYTSRFSYWCLSFWLSHKIPARTPLLLVLRQCPTYRWFYHSNYIWRRIQLMKLLIRQFSAVS
jgi:hypothetical protein